MAEIDRLETVISLREDPANASEASTLMGRITGLMSAATTTAKSVGTGVLAAGTAFVGFAAYVGQAVEQSSRFAKANNLSFEGLQELEYAAKVSGVSVDSLRGDLTTLYTNMNDLWPNEATWRMNSFGIKTKDAAGKARDAGEVMLELSEKMQGLSSAKQQNLAQKIGLSPETMTLLKQGPDAIRALIKEGHAVGAIIPESAAVQAEKFMGSLRKAKTVIEGLTFKMGIAFLPVLTGLLDKFNGWIMVNQKWISMGLEGVAKGVGEAFHIVGGIIDGLVDAFTSLVAPLQAAVPSLELADIVSMALTAAFTGLIAVCIAIAAKFALIGMAVGAVAIVIEDLVYFFQGKPSLTGMLFDKFEEKFPAIANALRGLANFFKSIFGPSVELVKSIFNALLGVASTVVGGILSLWEKLLTKFGITEVFTRLGTLIKDLLVDFTQLFNAIASMDLSAIWEAVTNLFSNLLKNIMSLNGAIIDMLKGMALAIADAVKNAFVAMFETVKVWVAEIVDWAAGKLKKIVSWIPGMGEEEEDTPKTEEQVQQAAVEATKTQDARVEAAAMSGGIAQVHVTDEELTRGPAVETRTEPTLVEEAWGDVKDFFSSWSRSSKGAAGVEPTANDEPRKMSRGTASNPTTLPVKSTQPLTNTTNPTPEVPRSRQEPVVVTLDPTIQPPAKPEKDRMEKPAERVVQSMVKMGEQAKSVPATGAPLPNVPGGGVKNNREGDTNTVNQSNTFNIQATDPSAAGQSVAGALTNPQFLQQMNPGNNAPTFGG